MNGEERIARWRTGRTCVPFEAKHKVPGRASFGRRVQQPSVLTVRVFFERNLLLPYYVRGDALLLR